MVHKAGFVRLGFVVALLGLLAGCTKILQSSEPEPSAEPRISAAEVRAYCPRVDLPTKDAFYTLYERGGEEDPSRIIYRVAIDKTTRACRYAQGQITMEVAAAGRIVPGPKFKPGAVNLPLYVKVQRGMEIVYDKKHQLDVTTETRGQATQFLFKDDFVTFEQPTSRNALVFIGLNHSER